MRITLQFKEGNKGLRMRRSLNVINFSGVEVEASLEDK